MSKSAPTPTDTRDDSVRTLDVTGYAGLVDTPTLEVAPLTDAIAVDVSPHGEEIALDVDTVAPGEVRVRSTGTLPADDARQLRNALDEALGELE